MIYARRRPNFSTELDGTTFGWAIRHLAFLGLGRGAAIDAKGNLCEYLRTAFSRT
jgi:hypothetical protein